MKFLNCTQHALTPAQQEHPQGFHAARPTTTQPTPARRGQGEKMDKLFRLQMHYMLSAAGRLALLRTNPDNLATQSCYVEGQITVEQIEALADVGIEVGPDGAVSVPGGLGNKIASLHETDVPTNWDDCLQRGVVALQWEPLYFDAPQTFESLLEQFARIKRSQAAQRAALAEQIKQRAEIADAIKLIPIDDMQKLIAQWRRTHHQPALRIRHIAEVSGVADEEVRIQTPLGEIAVQWEHDADGYASLSVLRIADGETVCVESWAHCGRAERAESPSKTKGDREAAQ